MGRVWSEEGKFRRWLEVEVAATETLAERGVVPAAAAAKIRENGRVDAGLVRRIAELEAKVKHDVIAFTMAVGETIGDADAARWLHYGMTSNDVVDTAQALQLREASRLIEHGVVRFGEVLERRAREFQHTPQIGRTHGVHAEPITFGLKIANWFAENRRNLERFGHAARPRSPSAVSSAAVRRCRTSAIQCRANRFAASRAWCGPMPAPHTKTSRFGTSATFRTARWNASFCPTPRFWPIICSRA